MLIKFIFGHKHKLTAIMANTNNGWGYPSGEWQVKYTCECGYKEVVELLWRSNGSYESEGWGGAVSNIRDRINFKLPKMPKTYNDIAEALKPQNSTIVNLKTRKHTKTLRRIKSKEFENGFIFGTSASNYYIPRGAYK